MDKNLSPSSLVSFALGALVATLVVKSLPTDDGGSADALATDHSRLGQIPDGSGISGARGSKKSPDHQRRMPETMEGWQELMEEPLATDEEIEAYLESQQRSKNALVAAGLLTRNDVHLKEAAERFPDDPFVQFIAISHQLHPERQREWVERFRASQPDNALAAYYMAGEYFKAGDGESGIAELRRGAALDRFEDFSDAAMLDMDAMALALGKATVEAKARSTFLTPVSYLGELHKITEHLAAARTEAASPERASELAAIGAAVGNDLSEGPASRTILNQVIGLGIEAKFLKELDPSHQSPYFSGNPEAMLAEIRAERDRILHMVGQSEKLLQLDEIMMSHYLDRMRTMGEAAAIEWLERQQATPP